MALAPSDTPPASIWLLTDGKTGDLAQCRGVAAYFPACHIEERVINPTSLSALPFPFMGLAKRERPQSENSPIAPPYPDLVIATGRRTLPYLSVIRSHTHSTKIVFLKKPPVLINTVADLIWVPSHDKVPEKGRNLIRSDTSPHAFTPKRLSSERKAARRRFPSVKTPTIAIFLGGDSKTVTWDNAAITHLALLLSKLPKESSLLITPSRRTPAPLLEAVKLTLAHHDAWFWDGSTDNPYGQMLAIADQIFVTGDSHNMVSEALASGASVHVIRPPGLKKKLHTFLDTMEEKGAITDASKDIRPFNASSIDATPEIASAVRELFTHTASVAQPPSLLGDE